MQARVIFALFALLATATVFAQSLVPVKPDADACVSQLWENQKDFLGKDDAERRELLANPEFRKRIVREPGGRTLPKPVDFEWRWSGDGSPKFSLLISESRDFESAEEILSDKPSAHATNFKIACKYFWMVLARTADGKEIRSQVMSFSTEDRAPRLLSVPNVGNFRDIGGRIGLQGKRVRQNMIFRNTAFNENSKDGISRGKDRFTDEGRTIALYVLKIKTELDLRTQKELGDLNASPLGSQVEWINISSPAYGDAFTEWGRAALIKDFKTLCSPGSYPVDIHCIAGADRTGTLCFILNAALGVPDAELIRDWEMTVFNTSADYFAHKKTFDKLTGALDKFGDAGESYAVKVERYLLSAGIAAQELKSFRSIMLED